MTKRKKVSVKKNITRRRNTFNNCNFKERNNMKDLQPASSPIQPNHIGGGSSNIHGAGDGITEEELWLSEFGGM